MEKSPPTADKRRKSLSENEIAFAAKLALVGQVFNLPRSRFQLAEKFALRTRWQ